MKKMDKRKINILKKNFFFTRVRKRERFSRNGSNELNGLFLFLCAISGLESISPTFYARHFDTKVSLTALLYLQLRFALFGGKKNSGTKTCS
jgi:hypothetical protein